MRIFGSLRVMIFAIFTCALLLTPVTLSAQVATPGATPDATPVATPDAAADATPIADREPPEGVLANAQRQVSPEQFSFTGPIAFFLLLSQFDTPENASAAIPMFVEEFTGDDFADMLGQLNEVEAPVVYGDETLLYEGSITESGFTFTFALIVIREGVDLHIWLTVAFGEATDEIIAIADPFFASERPQPDPTADDPSALLDRMPGLDDLPAGFVIEEETAEAAGDDLDLFGTPTAATPAA